MRLAKFKVYVLTLMLMPVMMLAGCDELQNSQAGSCLSDASSLERLKTNADMAFQKDGWCLLIFKTNKGTRSEGRHGRLFKDYKEMFAQSGEIVETPIGKLRYNGSEMELSNLWDTAGWSVLASDNPDQSEKPAGVSTFKPGRQKLNMDALEKSFEKFDAQQNQ